MKTAHNTHIDKPYRSKTKTKKNIFQILRNGIWLSDEISTKDIATIILLGIMLLMFIISLTGFFVMWFTEYYNDKLLTNVLLVNNSEAAKDWMNPNPKYDTILKVHIFNYTNIKEYLLGKHKKLKIKDVGPLTYREHTQRVNVTFNNNYTITYKEHRTYEFVPAKSILNEFVELVVPNVPLLSAAVKIDAMDSEKKFLANLMIHHYRENIYKTLTAHSLLWGYEDKIANLGAGIGTGKTHFGLLMNRNGTSPDSLQINTGEDDIHKFGIITQFNGMAELHFWDDSECNRIDGTDASRFPPHLLEQRQNLHVFLQVLCRKIPLHFEKEVTIYKDITALRYKTPLNIFYNPDKNYKNKCFCLNTESCMPSGIINATKCYDGAPIYPSFPHFFSGDKGIYKNIEGIYPNASLHQTFADIHPRFGFPISGASRIQINIRIHKKALRNVINEEKIGRIDDNLILPLIWIEITSNDPTDDIINKLFISTFGLNAIQCALKYGTLLASITLFGLIVTTYLYLKRKQNQQLNIPNSIQNNDSIQLSAIELQSN